MIQSAVNRSRYKIVSDSSAGLFSCTQVTHTSHWLSFDSLLKFYHHAPTLDRVRVSYKDFLPPPVTWCLNRVFPHSGVHWKQSPRNLKLRSVACSLQFQPPRGPSLLAKLENDTSSKKKKIRSFIQKMFTNILVWKMCLLCAFEFLRLASHSKWL